MDSFYRPTWVEISLDALKHNMDAFREILPATMKLMAVVKANAYGHGAKDIAQEAVRCGADYLGVAFLDEALELRNAGIQAPILVLGYMPPAGIKIAAEREITVTAFSEETFQALASVGAGRPAGSTPIKVHVKMDTGMGRLGIRDEQQFIEYVERLQQLPGVLVEGLFTHYACADETDKQHTYGQHRRFDRAVRYFADRGCNFPCIHAGNSATGIEFPELSYNMLRLGISLYGLYPSEEVNHQKVDLQPVMSYKTRVIFSKMLPPNSTVSYGAIYLTQGEEQIATLPIGYADGYTRMLTGKANVLVRGRKVPVVGKICMDQCMVNVTGLPDVSVGEEVVLFGEQQGQRILPDELARALGTINYEITCMVSNRVPRVYTRDGRVVAVANHLLPEESL